MKPALSSKKTRSAADRSKTFKDTFDNLVTAEQERIMDVSTSRPAPRNQRPYPGLNAFSMEEEQEVEVPLEAIQQVDADKMSILVSQLLAKNVLSPNIQKINAKNAFDVPMILLTQTQAFSEASSDNSWKRLSSTLESNNKIYGYRVDAAHNYTYRVLELFTRRENAEEREQDSDRRDKNELNNSISPFFCEDFDDCYAKYLEKNLKNINIQHLESFFNVNPVLEKTKRIFDQQGLGSLLLNSLDIRIDLSLRISLIQQTNFHEITTNAQENMILCELQCGTPPQNSNIFKIIQNTCYLNNLIERNEDFYLVKRETDEIEALWNDLEAEFACKRERRSVKYEQGARMPIQIEPENQQLLYQNCAAPKVNLQDPANPSSPTFHQVSNFTNNQSNFQSSTNAPFLTTQSLLGTNYDPLSNFSQMGLNISPSNNSHLSQDISNANLMDETQNHIQISSYIKMNKKWFSNDLVLQQLTEVDEGEGGEKSDLVEKWKNQQKKRKPREKKPIVEVFIDFLDKSDGVRVGRKHEVFNINKKEKAQFKRLLKNLKIPTYKDTNCVKDCKINFNVKYLLSRCEQIRKDCNITQLEQIEEAGMEVEVDNRIVIDLSVEDERWAAAKRNASIRQAKEFIKAQIDTSMEEQVSFASLYKNFQENDSLVSPALCFLTVLHLTNEHNYNLSQRDGEYNFLIRRQ